MGQQGRRRAGATVSIQSGAASYNPSGSPARLLASLNAVIRQPRHAWLAGVVGVALALFALPVHFSLSLVVLGGALYAWTLLTKLDAERRTFHLRYFLDDGAARRWRALGAALAHLQRAQRVWAVSGEVPSGDRKRHAGAASLIWRAPVRVSPLKPLLINTALIPYAISAGQQTLFFMPDMVYVFHKGAYWGLDYSSLSVVSGLTQFVEDEVVPTDTEVVGTTWLYVNKDGSPDRRFATNRELPIVRYAVVRLSSTAGYEIALHVSSVHIAQQFANALAAVLLPHGGPQRTASRPDARGSQGERPRHRNRGTTDGPDESRDAPVSPSSRPQCYSILGVPVGCSREEAAARYRQLVRQYHPDQVSTMGPEIRRLAEDKMKEINAAYSELRALRGW